MTGYAIRPASAADAEAVRGMVFPVLREFGYEPEPEGHDADLYDLDRWYDGRSGLFLVVVDPTGRVVGTGGLRRFDADRAEVKKMYLVPVARGRGLGRRVMDVLVGFARAAGYRGIVLESSSRLQAGLAFYERYGFRAADPRAFGYEQDRAFTMDLSPAMPEA